MFANIFPNTRHTQYFFKVHSESGRAFISNTQSVMNGLKNVEVLAEFKTDHNVISEFRRDASGGRRGDREGGAKEAVPVCGRETSRSLVT